jgi:hydroxypyruvate reductase
MATMDLYHTAAQIQRAALLAADPAEAVRRHVRRVTDWLLVGDVRYHLPEIERVFVVAIGKASLAMADAATDFLDDNIADRVLVTKSLPTTHCPPSTILGGHPVPDENSVLAGQRIADLLSQMRESDLVVCLISGGGSALVTHPVEGVTFDLQALTDAPPSQRRDPQRAERRPQTPRPRQGWRHRAHGGSARVLSLILSDVVGDPLDVIASGPTRRTRRHFRRVERHRIARIGRGPFRARFASICWQRA